MRRRASSGAALARAARPALSRRHGNGAGRRAAALGRGVRGGPELRAPAAASTWPRAPWPEDCGLPRRPPFAVGQAPGALPALAAAPRAPEGERAGRRRRYRARWPACWSRGPGAAVPVRPVSRPVPFPWGCPSPAYFRAASPGRRRRERRSVPGRPGRAGWRRPTGLPFALFGSKGPNQARTFPCLEGFGKQQLPATDSVADRPAPGAFLS